MTKFSSNQRVEDPEAVPIRHAATVLIVDERPDLQVLMVQRTSRAAFAASAWVFPGGRVDPEDADHLDAVTTGLDDDAASTILEVELPASFDPLPSGGLPASQIVYSYTAPNPTDLYSSGLSNAERLPNGNTLVCSGRQDGWMFELDPSQQIVWEYFNPFPFPQALVFQVLDHH